MSFTVLHAERQIPDLLCGGCGRGWIGEAQWALRDTAKDTHREFCTVDCLRDWVQRRWEVEMMR